MSSMIRIHVFGSGVVGGEVTRSASTRPLGPKASRAAAATLVGDLQRRRHAEKGGAGEGPRQLEGLEDDQASSARCKPGRTRL